MGVSFIMVRTFFGSSTMMDGGKTAKDKRLTRILGIMTLLAGGRNFTLRELTEQTGVVGRTLSRDIKTMRDAQIPIHYNTETQMYYMPENFFLRPVDLTFMEGLALVMLTQQLRGGPQMPFAKDSARAVAKIRAMLPTQTVRELKTIEDHVRVDPAAQQRGGEVLDRHARMTQAIQALKAVRCVYRSRQQQEGEPENAHLSTFVFRPYALMFNQRAWYAVGYHTEHKEVRSLKLSRFQSITPTTTSYAIPPKFSIEKYLGQAWRMIRGAEVYDIELEFTARFADTIADTFWHPSQKITRLPDGRLQMTLQVAGLDEIVWWSVGNGPDCRVLQPPELINLVREKARQIVAHYPSA
jgi:predicted DNA-binding transcriptional regulator YafY